MRRASGRRQYNAVRQIRARVRRIKVGRLWLQGLDRYAIAARVEVSERTVRRDLKALLRPPRAHDFCQACGRQFNPILPPGMWP
jgi:DNA-binding NarL/FixJ family response regulator